MSSSSGAAAGATTAAQQHTSPSTSSYPDRTAIEWINSQPLSQNVQFTTSCRLDTSLAKLTKKNLQYLAGQLREKSSVRNAVGELAPATYKNKAAQVQYIVTCLTKSNVLQELRSELTTTTPNSSRRRSKASRSASRAAPSASSTTTTSAAAAALAAAATIPSSSNRRKRRHSEVDNDNDEVGEPWSAAMQRHNESMFLRLHQSLGYGQQEQDQALAQFRQASQQHLQQYQQQMQLLQQQQQHHRGQVILGLPVPQQLSAPSSVSYFPTGRALVPSMGHEVRTTTSSGSQASGGGGGSNGGGGGGAGASNQMSVPQPSHGTSSSARTVAVSNTAASVSGGGGGGGSNSNGTGGGPTLNPVASLIVIPMERMVRELKQMGFTNEEEIRSGIQQCQELQNQEQSQRLRNQGVDGGSANRQDPILCDDSSDEDDLGGLASSSSTNGNSSRPLTVTTEDVMMFLVTQRENMEEARREDAIRMASEAEREVASERKKQDLNQQCAEASCFRDLESIFQQSWILQGLTNAVSSSVKSTILSRQREPFIEMLKLESKSRHWYGSRVPSHYFRKICNRLKERSSSYSWIPTEVDALQRGLFSISEQIGSTPKVFVEAAGETTNGDDDDDEVEIIVID